MFVQIILTALLAVLPACADETESNCGWDATVQGNGGGASYIDIGGRAYYLQASPNVDTNEGIAS